jgi:hypothetical protein
MKTKFLALSMALSFLAFTSCTNEAEPAAAEAAVTTNDVAASQKNG